MVVKTDLCSYSEYKIYPGRGIRYAQKDGRVSLFLCHKMYSLFKQKIKPVNLRLIADPKYAGGNNCGGGGSGVRV